MKKIIKLNLVLLSIILVISSCKKNNLVVDKDPLVPTALSEVNYTDLSPKLFPIGVSSNSYVVPIGVTSVSSVDRTINLAYTSTTGALQGTHFTAPASVVIKAGKATADLNITADYSLYSTGRVDSVKVKIAGGSIDAFKGKDSVVLVLQRYCDVILTDLSGDFTDTNEYTSANVFSYGPYTTSLANVLATSSTTATADILNIYDDGWNDIKCTLDWTSPANFKVTIPLQVTGKGYGGATSSSVRTTPTKTSTFSSCDRSLTLYIDLVNDATGVASTTAYKVMLK